MKCLLLGMWTWVLLVLMGSGRSMGCLKEERNALLNIEAAFYPPNGSSLLSWRDSHGDCCGWDFVECENTTSRVTGLYLCKGHDERPPWVCRDRDERRRWVIDASLFLSLEEFQELVHNYERPPWVIDASLFLPLEELQELDLSHNYLSDLNGMLHLKKLKRLDLSYNHLQRVSSLYKQTSMEAQNLSSSQLEGVKLEVLYLWGNNLGNDAFTDITRMTSLKALDIGDCKLNASSKLLEGEVPNWISSLRNLKFLLLQGNNFEGSIPLDLCLLKNMSILDLSTNNLSGQIPSCLKDLKFGEGEVSAQFDDFFGMYDLEWAESKDKDLLKLEEVKFMTKRRLEAYKGNILKLMSGMDLSHNNLRGSIPPVVGYLSELRALNLSHNHLTGLIPKTFSNLKNIESLDLSYNNLTGLIPPQLTELCFLSDFKLAYNNLSGRIPDRKNQFGTFGEENYEGNPLLCGPPLTRCDGSNLGHGTPPSVNHTREDDSWREAFLWSFAGSYVVAFFGVVLFLYVNSYYQFILVELVRKLIPSFP